MALLMPLPDIPFVHDRCLALARESRAPCRETLARIERYGNPAGPAL
jgi:hypothetical protein